MYAEETNIAVQIVGQQMKNCTFIISCHYLEVEQINWAI